MTTDRTLDIVILVLSVGLVGMGLLSIALGWIVNRFAPEVDRDVSDRTSSESSSEWVELPQISDTYQIEPDEPANPELAYEPIIVSHKMTRKELTIVLAVQKDGEGVYRFSANRIAEFVGGTGAETKGWVAEVRGKKESDPHMLRRPAGGWGKPRDIR